MTFHVANTGIRQSVCGTIDVAEWPDESYAPSAIVHRGSRRRSSVLAGIILTCVNILGAPAVAAQTQGYVAEQASKVLSYAISPNGKLLAEVEVGGAVLGPSQHIVIRRFANWSRTGRTIFVAKGIGRLYWMRNDEVVFASNSGEGKIILENINTGARRTLIRSPHPISIATIDRARHFLAYDYLLAWHWRHRDSVRVTDAMTTLELIAPVWARWPRTTVIGALRINGLHADRPAKAIKLKVRRFTNPIPPTLLWLRGRLLAAETAEDSLRTRLIDVETGRRVLRGMPFFRLLDEQSSTSGALAVLATRRWRRRVTPRCGCGAGTNLYIINSGQRTRKISAATYDEFLMDVSGMWWTKGRKIFIQAMGERPRGGAMRWFVEEVNTRTNRLVRTYYWPGGDLGGVGHACEFDSMRDRAVCIAQTLRNPPVLIELDLKTGAMRNLGQLDPAQRPLTCSFALVRVANRFGRYSTAFLAVPKRARRQPVPLAVMAYGFSEAYARDAQWIQAYPLERLVHSGIAVLLLNWTGIGAAGAHMTPFEVDKRALASALSLFKNAVPSVEAAGYRISRAEVMGWSFGGLFAAHAIQALPEYVAAQVGDPAAYDVTQYGLSNGFWRSVSDWYFGGPPVAQYLKRYQLFDPAGDGKPAHGPILFEFASRNPGAGQLLEEWRAVGTDVEAFAYRHSSHALTVPAEARVSRLRNLYWAELNLLGPQAVTDSELHSVGMTRPKTGWWVTKPARISARPDAAIVPRSAMLEPKVRWRYRRGGERALSQ